MYAFAQLVLHGGNAMQPLGSLAAALPQQVGGTQECRCWRAVWPPCSACAAEGLPAQHATLQLAAPACACSCVMPRLQGPGDALCHGSADDALLCCAPWGALGGQLRLLGQQHQVSWLGSRVPVYDCCLELAAQRHAPSSAAHPWPGAALACLASGASGPKLACC